MISLKDFNVSIEDFKSNISDEDVYAYYLGDFEDNSWFSSPWRSDSKPSLRISYYKDKWVWIDYGEDPRPQDAISFIQKYYNLTLQDALNKGWEDIFYSDKIPHARKRIIKHSDNSYCKIRHLNSEELSYWEKASITKKDLQHFSVYSGEIRHNNMLWHRSRPDDPLFIYMWDKTIPIYKGYRPFSTDSRGKFYAKNIGGHIQGLDLLPATGDILIITKSYKDVIVWNKLGYPAIAPHSENMFISEFDIFNLQKRFKMIYINYDNDDTGIKKSVQYSEEYGLNYFNLPVNTNCKDPFQFVLHNSYNELNELFINKIKRDEGNKNLHPRF